MNEKIYKDVNKYNMNPRISYSLLIMLLVNSLISSELFFVIAFCYLIFLAFIRNHGAIITKTGTNVIYLIIILLIGTSIGLSNIKEYGNHELIRDVFYILNPIIFINIGVYIKKTWGEKYDIYKTIIVLAVILSIISVLSLAGNIEIIKDANNIGTIRKSGYVSTSVVLGLVLLLTEEQRGVKYFRKGIKGFFIIICIVPLILSFSRTNLVCFLALFLPVVMNKTRISKRSIKKTFFAFIWTMVIFGAVYKIVPTVLINDFSTKMMRSFTELRTNSDWGDSVNIVNNWRGYEISCAKKVFSMGNIFNKFFGYGFGKGIDVGKWYYLVDPGSNGTIPVLHNGYYTMLIKNGIIGVMFLLMFYIANIKNAIKSIKNKWNIYDSKFNIGVLFALIFSTYYVAGIICKGSDFTMCILIGYISSNGQINKNTNSFYRKIR